MTLPYYASAEQIMRDRSELAKKGIARGKSVIVLTYSQGVLFVAENPSRTLHKISELYDRIGFAAVGKYNEFETLRRFGITQADRHGYEFDRSDVSGQSLANLYALYLGTVFTEQPKPYEVELCVAEVGSVEHPKKAQLFRVSYDGSIIDESHYIVMGGTAESIMNILREEYTPDLSREKAIRLAVQTLEKVISPTPSSTQSSYTTQAANISSTKHLLPDELEIACLDHNRPRRAFIRISQTELATILPYEQ